MEHILSQFFEERAIRARDWKPNWQNRKLEIKLKENNGGIFIILFFIYFCIQNFINHGINILGEELLGSLFIETEISNTQRLNHGSGK